MRSRYEKLQADWSDYLDRLGDKAISKGFEFVLKTARASLEHRGAAPAAGRSRLDRGGQIALLVESLGGETFDTDYF